MKTFTARDFNEKRQEIREAIKEGGCFIEYKLASREPDFKAVILPIEVYMAFKTMETLMLESIELQDEIDGYNNKKGGK